MEEYAWKSRMARAFTQRIYMIHDQSSMSSESEFHFKVMGNTDNAYDVVIDGTAVSCSCPDHSGRGNFCKHLMFVLIRVIGMQSTDVQHSYEGGQFDSSKSTLEHCVRFFANRQEALKMVRTEEDKRKPIEEDDECPICYEAFTDKEATVWCKAACGKSIHQSCFAKWSKTSGRGKATCVYCRSPWKL